MATYAFIGYGDLAARTVPALAAAGERLVAFRRNPAALPSGVEGIAADYTVAGALSALESLAPDIVVVTLKPVSRDPEGYRTGYLAPVGTLLAGLGGHIPRRVLFVSSTRVYAERDGGWVDEDSVLTDSDPPGMLIAEAERTLLASSLPTTVLRCGGIYGAGRGFLLERVARGSLCPPEPVSYTNRIHRDDVAGILVHLARLALDAQSLPDIVNVVDDDPAPQAEVEAWLAERCGLGPGDIRYDARRMTDGHKRCSNRRLHETGYRLMYPGFRAGYGAVLAGGAD